MYVFGVLIQDKYMTKSKKFLLAIFKLQTTPPENIEKIISCIDTGQKITFFSWKMFDIKIKDNIAFCDYNFDTEKADKLIDKEKLFLKILVDLEIDFDYLKIIPNELSKYFFDKSSEIGEMKFAQQVNSYFRKIYSPTKTFLLTDLLDKYNITSDYQSVFDYVYKNSDKLVDKQEMIREIQFRSTYYSLKPLEIKTAQELAKRAFALFAAETNCLFKLQKKNIFENLVLLSKSGSTNSYKYEFFKSPKSRPTLPKLFVI